MKKSIITLVLGLAIIPSVSFASFEYNLKIGATGQAVTELQDLLVDEGCLTVSPTGYFGLITNRAVKCFQTKYNLPATGYFGPMSRAKAEELVVNAVGEADAAELAEVGENIAPAVSLSPLQEDLVAKQALLQQLIQTLQAQVASQSQQTNAQIQNIGSQIQQVVTNTTPPPAPPAPVVLPFEFTKNPTLKARNDGTYYVPEVEFSVNKIIKDKKITCIPALSETNGTEPRTFYECTLAVTSPENETVIKEFSFTTGNGMLMLSQTIRKNNMTEKEVEITIFNSDTLPITLKSLNTKIYYRGGTTNQNSQITVKSENGESSASIPLVNLFSVNDLNAGDIIIAPNTSKIVTVKITGLQPIDLSYLILNIKPTFDRNDIVLDPYNYSVQEGYGVNF